MIGSLRNSVDWHVVCREKGDFTRELEKIGISHSVIPLAWDVSPKGTADKLRSVVKFTMNVVLALYLSFYVVTRRVGLIHSNSSVIFIGALVAFFTGRRHLWHLREFVYEDYNLKYNFGRTAFRFWADKAWTLICISKSIYKKRVVETGVTTRSVLIYNGLVSDPPVKRTATRKDIVTLGVVGVIDPAKDQLTAIKAVHLLNTRGYPTRLKIVGEVGAGPYFETLEDYIKAHKLENAVDFTGFSKDVDAIYNSLDITLMCSQNEAMGRVTIESMMRGVPVVAYDSGGSSELIEHERTGLLFKGGEAVLADQIVRLLEDPDLYRRISEQAQEHASANFTVSQYAKNFFNEVTAALAVPE
ncbi:glycosyltransferase family 4 protein [Dyadobacter sp. 676]|uniref:Glycosyltransferase family 4 protein n=1 Tax=Dyadobacter sp. 676 TaxID=3088362 RepID=A0AAU8FRI4_9BACT